MMRRAFALIVVCVLAPAVVDASTMWNPGPLMKMNDISIKEVLIGPPLDRHKEASDLYQADPKGMMALENRLRGQIGARLEAAGVHVNSKSRNAIGFRFFGGKFPSSGCSKNIYLVEVWTASRHEDESVDRTILGVAADEEIAEALLEASTSAVDEFLTQRRNYRAYRNR